MVRTLSTLLLCALIAASSACGDSEEIQPDAADTSADITTTPGEDIAIDPDAPDAAKGPDISTPDINTPDTVSPQDSAQEQDIVPDEDTASVETKPTPRFSQASSGTMWANPELNPEIPVYIRDATMALSVTVTLNGEAYVAEAMADAGSWVAVVDISNVPSGAHPIVALAEWEEETRQASANLHVGTEGVQFTDYEMVGPAATPRIHLQDDQMWITWVDHTKGKGRAWLQRISGAGKAVGAQVGLTPEHIDIQEGRAVFGNLHVGLLYRVKGDPERNWFTVVNTQGVMKQIPIQLELGADKGEWGGDLSFDGEAFAVYSRSRNATTGFSEIRGLRVQEDPIEVGEPFVVTSEGDDAPNGTFPAKLFIGAESIGDVTIITFTRDLYNYFLDMTMLANHATVLNKQGEILHEGVLPTGILLPTSYEAHVHRVHDEFLVLWVAANINESDDITPNQPQRIYGSRVGASAVTNPAQFPLTQILKAPHARGEVAAIGHPHHYAVLAWTDQRTHADGSGDGKIDLRYQPVDGTLKLASSTPLGSESLPIGEMIVPHARFIADSAQINGVALDTNIFLTWTDERHGGTMATSKPEVYFETIWY